MIYFFIVTKYTAGLVEQLLSGSGQILTFILNPRSHYKRADPTTIHNKWKNCNLQVFFPPCCLQMFLRFITEQSITNIY